MRLPLLIALLLTGLISSALYAEEPIPAAAEKKDVISFPHVTANRAAREVTIEANLSPALSGAFAALEFLLISGKQNTDTGEWLFDRDYESVFVTQADPNKIHVALMLAGLLPGPMPAKAPDGFSKDNVERIEGTRQKQPALERAAARVEVFVEWTDKQGKTQRLRAEKFLFDRARGANAADTSWAFTGSYFVTNAKGEKTIAARQTDVVVAVFHDPSAILNLPVYTKNAHWGEEVGFELNAAKLPPFFRKDKEIQEGMGKRVIQVPANHKHPLRIILRPAPKQDAPISKS